MSSTIHKEPYILRLDKLAFIIKETTQRIISDSDSLVMDNANFFTKAFLTTMCAYLESYLKDALMVIIDEFNQRLSVNKLPHSLVRRSFNIKAKKDDPLESSQLRINITKKDLDGVVSGNPYATKKLFKDFGINLGGDDIFNSQEGLIMQIVNKRNSIMHHGDEASDVSGGDLINNIKLLTEYIENLDALICKYLER